MIWYAKTDVARFGEKALLGEYIENSAIKRLGYLTGVDILCDGGCVASREKCIG